MCFYTLCLPVFSVINSGGRAVVRGDLKYMGRYWQSALVFAVHFLDPSPTPSCLFSKMGPIKFSTMVKFLFKTSGKQMEYPGKSIVSNEGQKMFSKLHFMRHSRTCSLKRMFHWQTSLRNASLDSFLFKSQTADHQHITNHILRSCSKETSFLALFDHRTCFRGYLLNTRFTLSV